MSKYIIKTDKIGEGMYNHSIFDAEGNLLKEGHVLENGLTVKETIFYCGASMVPFIRKIKSDSLETKIELIKNDN